MPGAGVGGSAPDLASLERFPVLGTQPTADTGRLEATGMGSAISQEVNQYLLKRRQQAISFLIGQASCWPGRVDPRPPQRLIADQVADACDPGAMIRINSISIGNGCPVI